MRCWCGYLSGASYRLFAYGPADATDLKEARDDGDLGWQWHQLDHMQSVCTLLQTDNHGNTPSLSFLQAKVCSRNKLVKSPSVGWHFVVVMFRTEAEQVEEEDERFKGREEDEEEVTT